MIPSLSIESVVRQGHILCPLLFLHVLDYMMTKVNAEKLGIQWIALTQVLEDLDCSDEFAYWNTLKQT